MLAHGLELALEPLGLGAEVEELPAVLALEQKGEGGVEQLHVLAHEGVDEAGEGRDGRQRAQQLYMYVHV